jgi:Kef-type K+ transport system membrane component KefB
VDAGDLGLVLIPLLAVAAPLLARGIRPVIRVPIIVFELVLGILAGPAVLGWVEPTPILEKLSDFGLAMLFYMAGSEIDFVDNLLGQSFQIKNPNAVASCGCGTSFSI